METLTTWPLTRIEPRPYQTEALARMVERGNQLLALVMGAGKTVTSLAAVELLADAGEVTTGWIFCPNSVKFQWLGEIRRHIGPVAQVIDGSAHDRLFQYKHAGRFRYNISNYDVLRNDLELLRNWVTVPDFVIADEATQIKSGRAKRSRILKTLSRDVPYRYALTGQPIENRPEELFSIMEFVDRSVLGPFTKFDKTFILRDNWGKAKKYQNMHLLQGTMAPVMYRKSRKDIAQYLPKIIPMELPVELPPTVRALYDFIAADCLDAIEEAIATGNLSSGFNVLDAYGRTDKAEGGRAMGQIMSRLTCMRMLCDSPTLLAMSADEYDDPESSRGAAYASWLKEEGWLDGLIDDTKLIACADQVEEIVTQGLDSKVVVFSFFKPMLRMIGRELRERGIQAAHLNGDMNARSRQESLHWLQHHGQVLLSSDAGQYGIDLPFVNYLISYDLPWSAGAYAQRVARIDRTSSTFPHVTVITMLAKRTIEQRQFDMLTQKRMVAEAWVDGQHIDAKGTLTLNLESLRQFLEAA